MPLEIKFHPLALSDLEKGIEYYEEQETGLGYTFLEYVEEITKIISNFPTIYPSYDSKEYRKAVIPKFPYILL